MYNFIMALNCGSSSVKFNVFEIQKENYLKPVIQGAIEEIGNGDRSRLKYLYKNEKHTLEQSILSHQDAFNLIFSEFKKIGIDKNNICAIGHRVVHGGDKYKESVRIDNRVIQTIRDLIPIAPLHNPPNLRGIEEMTKLLPGASQVAVFDTAFHGSMEEYAFRYALPQKWYKDFGVRRYGFHGTSHLYVARRAAKVLNIPYEQFNCITAHLGNGCSITKISRGKSADTSMGFTPLEGLVMGTRSGDIDPALISHVAGCLVEENGIGEAEAYVSVMNALNNESGLMALGKTNIMQDLRQNAINGDVVSQLAISIYAYRVAKYIGAYWATLPYVQAIVFTAGVGENEWYVREKILNFLENLSIKIDNASNKKRKLEIIIGKSDIKSIPLNVLVIPTDEEIVIGYDALFLGYLNNSVPKVYPFEKI